MFGSSAREFVDPDAVLFRVQVRETLRASRGGDNVDS